MIREAAREKRKQAKKIEALKKAQEAEKKIEAEKSLKAWESKKEEKIKSLGLFTYTQKQEAIHATSWCPARTLHKYKVNPHRSKPPRQGSREKDNSHSSKHSHSSDGMNDTYSLSFESEASVSHHSSDGNDGNNLSDSFGSSSLTSSSVSRTESLTKGTHKTIQVCCQTLHYWCTCDQQ